jgi:hypothetical protein
MIAKQSQSVNHNHCTYRGQTIGSRFKLHVSGNGKRQVQILLAKFSLNVFVSYFLSCVERIIMYFSFTVKQQVHLLFIA